jgi:hypothetical protein
MLLMKVNLLEIELLLVCSVVIIISILVLLLLVTLCALVRVVEPMIDPFLPRFAFQNESPRPRPRPRHMIFTTKIYVIMWVFAL